ncbi:efflux RND transporter permease subunit [Saccharospirillum mangrovi]|uniref:efflux RND transporter permease subunit n=1 Tax=Saccharospirillum mangrovi TaxID=2161747 RepID=UPI000D3DB04B|nr:efflux RND transporter permease subunit [Saccharospirillum mangrovi]
MNGFYDQLLRHKLAANLMMLLVIGAGLWGLQSVRSQLFPDYELPLVRATFSWDNADVDTIRTQLGDPLDQKMMDSGDFNFVRAVSYSGGHRVFAAVKDGLSVDEGFDTLEKAIDDIGLPSGASIDELEKIEVTEPVASVLLYGDIPRSDLASLGYQAQQSLLAEGVAVVELSGVPGRERVIDVDLTTLGSLGLTLDTLASRISAQFSTTPAGTLAVGANSTSLVTDSPDWTVNALNDAIIAQNAGGVIRLSQVAQVSEQYDNTDVLRYQGMPAVKLEVSRVAGEDTLENAELLDNWMAKYVDELPYGVGMHKYNEIWQVVQDQLNLVIGNGLAGMVLVLLVLFVFLRTRLAIWVAAGIPVSFMGTLAFMGYTDTTINTISLFGFVIAIGIIVDDAIVVAEDAAALESQGLSPEQASRTAAKRMMPAVIASSLTTIAAFLPLLLIGGSFGSLLVDIPTVVTAAIIASLVECFVILPGHLGHNGKTKPMSPARQRFEDAFHRFRDGPFQRLVKLSLSHASVFVAAVCAVSLLTLGAVTSGRIEFEPSPSLDQPTMSVTLDLLDGTTLAEAEDALDQLQAVVEDIDESVGGGLIANIVQQFASVDEPDRASLELTLTSDTNRPLTNAQVLQRIQSEFQLPDVVRAYSTGRFFRGPGGGGDLEIRLVGDNIQELKRASLALQTDLQAYSDVLSDITDDLPLDGQQYEMSLTQAAQTAAVDMSSVASQVASQLSGKTLTTVQEGDQEIPVVLQLVEHQRESDAWLETLPIQLSDGSTRPLGSLVNFKFDQGLNRITSRDGQLEVEVTATYNGDQLTDFYPLLEDDILPALSARYDIDWTISGQAEELESFFNDTLLAVSIAVLLIYLILAWVFESWLWPFAILITVPFGLTGAVIGHWLMGMPLSTISVFGLIGLSGIVINDAIILVTVFRRLHNDGISLYNSAVQAALSRLRPVILTSITTMAGLIPLLFETSVDAALLKPIAVGLVFGLGFGTLLILLLVPILLYQLGLLKARIASRKGGGDPEFVKV